MQDTKFTEAKMEIRSVLLTYQKPVALQQFLRSYLELLGKRLPSKEFGFHSDVAFLQSMPDAVSVCTDSSGKIQLSGIADDKSQHIQKLVSRQRNNRPNNNKSNKRQPNRTPPSNPYLNVRKQTPFLPGPLRAEILELMSGFKNGISMTAFVLAYNRKFNKSLRLISGLNTLEAMIKLIPQLEVRSEANVQRIYHSFPREAYENKSSSYASEINDKAEYQAKICINIHKSGISEDVLQNFLQILKKCPEGIQDIHFPLLYEHLTGNSFDLHDLGYNSMLDLVDALPHIFKRVIHPDNDQTWLILPASSPYKQDVKNDSSVSSRRYQSPLKTGGIPAEAASPVLQYIEPTVPEDVDLTEYIPVFVSAIENPSLFWFQIQTDEAVKSFHMFEQDMRNFYKMFADEYKMKSGDIAIGATCVILCPDDNDWYRAVIKAIPSVDLVNVSFVDFGSRENIPRANLYYVRSKYHDYPAYAFKACLADVKPSDNASMWNTQARHRFIQLCSSGILMANVKCVDKGTYSVYLCDTNGETDLHLINTLIGEGLAELSFENQLDIHNYGHESHGKTDIYHGTNSDSGGEYSAKSTEGIFKSVKKYSDFGSEFQPINRKLCFSSPNLHSEDLNPNDFSSIKAQKSKRYVNLLELSEEIKIHVINLENELYMPCAEIAKLIWSERNSNFLLERLKYKEIDVPFLRLVKETHAELFKQCLWYKIPEWELLESHNSILIVCPLEWAPKILNVFGHPSIYIRLAIQFEIRIFDPADPIWEEFCYDVNDVEKEIEQNISKLCVYDLKAKNEILKVKKLKLQRIESSSVMEEIKAIELQQRIIERRIKEIESLCSKYSSMF